MKPQASRVANSRRSWPVHRGAVVVTAGVVVAFLAGLVAQRAVRQPKPVPEPEVVAVQPEAGVVTPVVNVTPAPIPVVPPETSPIEVPPPPHSAANEPVAAPATPPAPPEIPVVEPPAPVRVARPVEDRAARSLVVHTLPVRLDPRPGDQLERDLFAAKEVALDLPHNRKLSAELLASVQKVDGGVRSPTVVLACQKRPDLAGLPFRAGPEAALSRDRAEAMDALSKQLREVVAKTFPAADRRPDPARLFVALSTDAGGGPGRKPWATSDAVPCIQQMLQAEGGPVRRMSCELLRDLPGRAAPAALASWAVFDTDPDNRAAAVDALRGRDPRETTRLLAAYLRYPWPRAVEHACEALIALECKDAVPDLVAAYGRPDPDAPFHADLPGSAGGTYRYEIVRVNHPRNCMLCHPPSFSETDLVRGAVPAENRPLPTSSTPAYYSGSSQFVAAETTYLQQDFSVVQPVANPGVWPTRQRFDYFVTVRRENTTPAARSAPTSPYRTAYRAALRELAGHDPDVDRDWYREQRATGPAADGRAADAARAAVLATAPAALVAVKKEFQPWLLRLSDAEVGQAVQELQANHGPAARLALIAHLYPFTQDADAATAAKAARVYAVVRGPTPDATLAAAVRSAVRHAD